MARLEVEHGFAARDTTDGADRIQFSKNSFVRRDRNLEPSRDTRTAPPACVNKAHGIASMTMEYGYGDVQTLLRWIVWR